MLRDLGPLTDGVVPADHVAMPPVLVPRRQGLTLLELTSRSCRWPIGDPKTAGIHFCGATTDVQPYCSVHRLAAYPALPQR